MPIDPTCKCPAFVNRFPVCICVWWLCLVKSIWNKLNYARCSAHNQQPTSSIQLRRSPPRVASFALTVSTSTPHSSCTSRGGTRLGSEISELNVTSVCPSVTVTKMRSHCLPPPPTIGNLKLCMCHTTLHLTKPQTDEPDALASSHSSFADPHQRTPRRGLLVHWPARLFICVLQTPSLL